MYTGPQTLLPNPLGPFLLHLKQTLHKNINNLTEFEMLQTFFRVLWKDFVDIYGSVA